MADKDVSSSERFTAAWEGETPHRFSSEELIKGFSTELGFGASGKVYKGVLRNGVESAVKVLSDVTVSGIIDQFEAEVNTLGKTHHVNLVKLHGFCFEPRMKAIVYEYMENGSLDKVLKENKSIKWETLCEIAIGIARGLSYLHIDCQPKIIHYDIKPSNILLDSNFVPKIGDFGIAIRLKDKTHFTVPEFRGTLKYAAPELRTPWSETTHKCDVYSYGIMLFDILGRRRIRHLRDEAQSLSPRHVWDKFVKGQQDEVMEDCAIEQKDREAAKRIFTIALRCVKILSSERPSMDYVVRILESREEVEMPPSPVKPERNSFPSFDPEDETVTEIDTPHDTNEKRFIGVSWDESRQKQSFMTIRIAQGDTLWKLSRKHKVPIDAIKKANDLANDMIFAGEELVIPILINSD